MDLAHWSWTLHSPINFHSVECAPPNVTQFCAFAPLWKQDDKTYMRCKGVGSHPSPPPLSGLCSLPQHGEGQAGAPSPGPGRPPQDVKKIFSKQPGGRLGLALKTTPSFVEAFPSFLLSSHSWLRQGPPLAAPSFSSTVTQASLACPGKWWCIDYCLLGLMRGSGQDPWTPCLGLHTGHLPV